MPAHFRKVALRHPLAPKRKALLGIVPKGVKVVGALAEGKPRAARAGDFAILDSPSAAPVRAYDAGLLSARMRPCRGGVAEDNAPERDIVAARRKRIEAAWPHYKLRHGDVRVVFECGDYQARDAAGDQRGSPPLKMRNAMIRRRKNLLADEVQRLPALDETRAEVVQVLRQKPGALDEVREGIDAAEGIIGNVRLP